MFRFKWVRCQSLLDEMWLFDARWGSVRFGPAPAARLSPLQPREATSVPQRATGSSLDGGGGPDTIERVSSTNHDDGTARNPRPEVRDGRVKRRSVFCVGVAARMRERNKNEQKQNETGAVYVLESRQPALSGGRAASMCWSGVPVPRSFRSRCLRVLTQNGSAGIQLTSRPSCDLMSLRF